jgi:hypothetical protein
MEAKELRIGNLVTLNNKIRKECFENQIHAHNDFFEVKTIYSDGDVSLELDDEIIDLSEDEVDLIPLTEELLLKFGFKLSSTTNYTILGMDIWKCNETLMCDKNGIIIKSVHQLQNLYFALTQKELTFK